MKLVKKILLAIAIIIAIPLVIAIFVKKEYEIEREVIIQKPRQEVFSYLKHLKNQDQYNKWVMMDPNIKKEYKGTDGTVGFVYCWASDEVGKGEQEIKKITEGERIDMEIRFIEPFAGIAYTPFTTEAVSENETRVRWAMKGKSSYPMNIMNLFMNKTLGESLEGSLATLKTVLESQ
jgi:uncharacterized protein YndB with AHSA1/START domain